jgi:hypothetical protein
MSALEMTCDRCPVRPQCPKSGSSPLIVSGGKRVHCRILGGFGRQPVDVSILSEESRRRMEADGPCLTLAEVPGFEDGQVSWTITKVFAPAVLNARESTVTLLGGQLNPKNPGS